jgi:hypothetical protein
MSLATSFPNQAPPLIDRRTTRKRTALLFWLAVLALSLPILSSRHFPSEDGPAYLYWTTVYRELGRDTGELSQVFERNARWNTPNLAYFGLQYGLSSVLDPHLAERVLLLLLLLGWGASIHVLSLVTAGRLTLGSFAALLLFHNWALYIGFFSFLFGIPAFVCGVALLVRLVDPGGERQPTWRYVLLASLAILAYYLHLVPGVLLTGAIVFAALVAWRRCPTQGRRLLLTAMAPVLMIIGFVLANSFGEGGVSWAVGSTIKRFVGFALWRGFARPDAGFWITLLLFAGTCSVLTLMGARSWRRGELPPGSQFVMMLATCLLALYFVAPIRVGIGGFLNDRINLALWAILLPVLGVGLGRKLRAGIALTLAVLLAWQVVDFSLRARRFGEQFEALLAEAERIPRGSTIEYVQPYEASRVEGSFAAPFMDGGEIAYHCRCLLIGNYWQNSPFYWVRTRPGAPTHVDYLVSFERPSELSGARRTEADRPLLRVEPGPP